MQLWNAFNNNSLTIRRDLFRETSTTNQEPPSMAANTSDELLREMNNKINILSASIFLVCGLICFSLLVYLIKSRNAVRNKEAMSDQEMTEQKVRLYRIT